MLGDSFALEDEYDNLEEMQEIEDLKTRWCLQSQSFGISQHAQSHETCLGFGKSLSMLSSDKMSPYTIQGKIMR